MFIALDLSEKLRPRLGAMALACYQWLARNVADEHPWLSAIKNSAYAWRQMVFFLSIAGPSETGLFFERASSQRRSPRVEALLANLQRCYFEAVPVTPFLGWTVGRHPVFGNDI